MTGYDVYISNPFDPIHDPGEKNRIFLHDCYEGYYDFISDIRLNTNCESDFSMKSIKSVHEYTSERERSNSVSKGIEIGMFTIYTTHHITSIIY